MFVPAGAALASAAVLASGPFTSAEAAEVEKRAPRTFKVGPKSEFRKPSDVVRLIRSGDRVEIAPGSYADCAVWPRNLDGLTIQGRDVVLLSRTCQDKAIFVVSSRNVVIRGITFMGARSSSYNGAGIRAQGQNLTVENSRFIDNENGILGDSVQDSTVVVRNSLFKGNGSCTAACAHGIYINGVARLRVEGSEFVDTHFGHHIKSRALRTEIVDNAIHDGPSGNSSYLINMPNGGSILIAGNHLEKGPLSENREAAISIGEEAKIKGTFQPTPEIRVENNSFSSGLPNETAFLRNYTATAAVLRDNMLSGQVRALLEPRE